MQDANNPTLEDLVAEAFRRTREFVAAIRAVAPACTARDSAFIMRCVARLEDGRLFDDDADGALAGIRDIICRATEAETIAQHRVFDGYHDPEIGDVGRIIEIPVRTDRGEELAGVLARLDALAEARAAAMDRLRAENEVRRQF